MSYSKNITSIIVPFYNEEAALEESILNLVSQLYFYIQGLVEAVAWYHMLKVLNTQATFQQCAFTVIELLYKM